MKNLFLFKSLKIFHPHPLGRGMEPRIRIRIRTKMLRIRNTERFTEIELNGKVGSYAAVSVVQYIYICRDMQREMQS
jgi:hypothetical protein